MSKSLLALAAILLSSMAAIGCANAQDVSAAQVASTDYGNPAIWLCKPERQDACTVSQDATIVAVNGTLTREAFHPAKNPPIDCFYVYPTVSNEAGGNSDLTITGAEKLVVSAQFARFAAKCRLFAPMYRQVTLTALRSIIAGKPMPFDRDLGYSDVLAAWKYYLSHDNNGRGVVLVGHSQGSLVLTRLIAEEIDGKPVQDKLISAILMGTNLPVPAGADVGGAFKHIPVCHSSTQSGCAIAFADFRANMPPPANTRFGKAPDGMQAVCANPAALGGGSGALEAYLSVGRISNGSDGPREPFDWTHPAKPIGTSFVKVPGLLSAACVSDDHGTYLAVTVHPTPGGARTNDISGDVMVNGQVYEDWGLHLIDANLTMGNLIAIVGDETKAYLAKAKKLTGAASPIEYSIEAIRYGISPGVPVGALIVDGPKDEQVDVNFVIWLIRGGGRNILFDSGFHRERWFKQWKVTDYLRPDEAVRQIGIKPEDITDVVISHAHWDHMGGIDLFPKATVWIQAEEFRYYTGDAWQAGGQNGGIDADDVQQLVRLNTEGRLRLVNGDNVEIIPGIRMYVGSRHTFASQYMRVDGTRPYVLASDNVYFYRNLSEHKASATFADADHAANIKAQERMIELAGSVERVVPGHDALQFQKFPTHGRVAKIE